MKEIWKVHCFRICLFDIVFIFYLTRCNILIFFALSDWCCYFLVYIKLQLHKKSYENYFISSFNVKVWKVFSSSLRHYKSPGIPRSLADHLCFCRTWKWVLLLLPKSVSPLYCKQHALALPVRYSHCCHNQILWGRETDLIFLISMSNNMSVVIITILAGH